MKPLVISQLYFVMLGIFVIPSPALCDYEPWEKVSEEVRRKWNEQYDKQNLYKKSGMMFDTSPKFINVPKEMNREWLKNVDIAKNLQQSNLRRFVVLIPCTSLKTIKVFGPTGQV